MRRQAGIVHGLDLWLRCQKVGHAMRVFSMRADAIRKSGLDDIDRAIVSLESAQGEAALAAQARLVKANMFYFFRIDERKSRAEAQRAAAAFRALPTPDALGTTSMRSTIHISVRSRHPPK